LERGIYSALVHAQIHEKVNPIQFATTASLRAIGEACCTSGNRFLTHREKQAEEDFKHAKARALGENY
jgi:hypothetical protein